MQRVEVQKARRSVKIALGCQQLSQQHCAAGSAALDAGDAWAASALSPRHSGLEPPGGPKPMEGLPAMGNAGNTTERGMGYTDAYGRPLKDYGPEEVKPRKRPRGGAYGTYGRKQTHLRP